MRVCVVCVAFECVSVCACVFVCFQTVGFLDGCHRVYCPYTRAHTRTHANPPVTFAKILWCLCVGDGGVTTEGEDSRRRMDGYVPEQYFSPVRVTAPTNTQMRSPYPGPVLLKTGPRSGSAGTRILFSWLCSTHPMCVCVCVFVYVSVVHVCVKITISSHIVYPCMCIEYTLLPHTPLCCPCALQIPPCPT